VRVATSRGSGSYYPYYYWYLDSSYYLAFGVVGVWGIKNIKTLRSGVSNGNADSLGRIDNNSLAHAG